MNIIRYACGVVSITCLLRISNVISPVPLYGYQITYLQNYSPWCWDLGVAGEVTPLQRDQGRRGMSQYWDKTGVRVGMT